MYRHRHTQHRFNSHTDVCCLPSSLKGHKRGFERAKPYPENEEHRSGLPWLRWCCVCLCEDGGRRKWDRAGEVWKKKEKGTSSNEGKIMERGQKIEATVVIVEQNALAHTQRHILCSQGCFVYQAVKCLRCLCWVQWSSSRYYLFLLHPI